MSEFHWKAKDSFHKMFEVLFLDKLDCRNDNEVSRKDCHTFQLHIIHHDLPNM